MTAPRQIGHHPFAEMIDLHVVGSEPGRSEVSLRAGEQHLNPHRVVHGAVLFAMADTGMGAALYPTLQPGEICATIEIKINFFKPVTAGAITCRTEVVNRGKTVANLVSNLYRDEVLVAQANGNYAIFRPSKPTH